MLEPLWKIVISNLKMKNNLKIFQLELTIKYTILIIGVDNIII